MVEKWKPIKNFEGYYEVSNLGNIRSVDRVVYKPKHKTQKYCTYKGKNISTTDLYGYKICSLYRDGKYHNVRVHRLVAEAFCDDYFDGCEVHHKDNNRSNNIYTNLKCSTKLEHLSTHNKGKKRIKSVSSSGEVTFYDGVREAARLNGVSHQSIVAVLKGKRPSCLGCKWLYVKEAM